MSAPRVRFLVAALIATTACVSSARVERLETRLAAAEAAHARTEFELRATVARLEAMLGSLAGSVTAAAEVAERAAELEAKLAELAANARPTPPPPPPRRPGPDPTKVYAVPVAGHPVRGKATALVTIVRAGEYACPYCERVRPTLDELRANYGDKLRVVYRTFVVHAKVATYAAQAACAAHRQGKFWDLDTLLWDRAFAKREFEPAQIDALAQSAGLDLARYRADVAACQASVSSDQAELSRFGVSATPVFFINGRFLAGAQPAAAFRTLIDEELAKAEAAVKRGVKASRYYEQEVVAKGLPSL